MITVLSLLEISIWMVLMFGLYSLIRNLLAFNFRRFVLLFIPILAVATHFLKQYLMFTDHLVTIPVIELAPVEVANVHQESLASNMGWIEWYGLGLGLMISFFLYKIIKVLILFKGARKLPDHNIYLISSEKKSSFSFFNRVHLTAGMNDFEKDVVLEHEIHHVRKLHSLDILIMEIYHSLFWFNPLFFWVKKELVQVHEFEVDQVMYARHKTSYLEVLLAHTLGSNSAQVLLTSQFFNKLSLTKRFQTMKTNRKNKNTFFLLIPALAGLMALVSWTDHEKVTDAPIETGINDSVYATVDKQPEFVGGNEALVDYMSQNVHYPKEAEKQGIEGKVFIQFVVDADGSVRNAEVLKGAHDLLDAEALRVVKSMPKWVPGEQNGQKVKVKMTLPIVFKL